jgi:glycosyltransferase involved in cell wall biosynthesis
MKIGIVITQAFDPNAGGVQRVSDSIAQIFKKFNHDVIIISFSKEIKNYSNSDLPIISVSDENSLQKILKEEKINVLINQEGYSIAFTKMLLKNKSTATYMINNLHINPLNFVDNHKEFIALFLKRYQLAFLNNYVTQKLILWYHIGKQRYELNYIIKNTNAFVMLSERFKTELYSLAPALQRYNPKIHGIGNPFERPNLQVEKLEKENSILFVGRLNILQKRVDLLLQIWKQLHKSCPDWQFWVVGEGEDQEFMKTFCKENKLDRVTFFGKDNPTDYYKKAKLFHMTSAFEGFGNVLVEAQSYGCVPILFNSYSAAQDIVNHDTDGILVKPFDTNAYVFQTLKLINNPEKLQNLALNAFENVSRFSYEATYKKWDTVFKSLE